MKTLLIIVCTLFCLSTLSAQSKDHFPLLHQKLFEQVPESKDSALWIRSVLYDYSFILPSSFFCVLENKRDRKTPIKLRFRLGTVQYVDQLEGK